MCCRDKDHLAQTKGSTNLFGNSEMTKVNRVERTAKDPDLLPLRHTYPLDHRRIEFTRILEEMPDDPGEILLILSSEIIDVGIDQLVDISTRQEVDSRTETRMNLEG